MLNLQLARLRGLGQTERQVSNYFAWLLRFSRLSEILRLQGGRRPTGKLKISGGALIVVGRLVVVWFMQPVSLVIYLNVPEYISFRVLACPETFIVQPFLFQLAPETLHRSVVPAISFTAHRADESILFELVLIIMWAVLASTIRMSQDAFWIPSSDFRLPERIEYKLLRHSFAHCPADYLAAIQIEDAGYV